MSALRLARGFTGRTLTVKFEGCYHGHVDSLLVRAGSGVATLGISGTAGVPEEFARTTIALPFNSVEALEAAFDRHGPQIAAVIVEPVVGNMGCVPPRPGFLEAMRELCTRHGALLIFDEVMTGFRLSLGGAQQLYGIRPDLTTLGKIIGGGLPIAAYGGRADIMRHVAPAGSVYQAGTLSGNPCAVAAGIAVLRYLIDHPEIYARIDAVTAKICEAAPPGVTVQRVGSMFTFFFTDRPVASWAGASTCDTGKYAAFFHHLLERGVYFPPSQFEAAFVSAAHDEARRGGSNRGNPEFCGLNSGPAPREPAPTGGNLRPSPGVFSGVDPAYPKARRAPALRPQALALPVLLAAAALWAAAAPPDPRESLNLSSKTRFTPKYYSDLKTWEARREQLRKQILVAAGLHPLRPRPPVPVHRFGKIRKGIYTVEKIALETLPGFVVGANLYMPAGAQRPSPAVLVAHGHWKHGRTHHAEDYSVPALCANLAAQGFVVLAWDMVGYEDTQQLPHDFGRTQDELVWLFSPFSLQLWNAIRALDFVELLPEVNRFLIGMTGASGGGTQTYLLAAVDERIRAAAPGGMVSASFQGDDVCEMALGLRIDTNNVELASLIAPRHLMLVAATGDWTRDTPRIELPAIRSVYALYGQERRATAAMIDAGHNCNRQSREAIYAFFHRTLARRSFLSPAPRENPALPLPARDELLIGEAIRTVARAAPADILAAWRRMAIERTASMSDAELRDRLAALFHVSMPREVATPASTHELVLLRTDTGTPVRARWVSPPGPDVPCYEIAVSPEGLACSECQKLPETSGPAPARLLIEVFRASAPPQPFELERATFHRSPLAERVQDILAAVAYVRGFAGDRPVDLLCHGNARGWCLLALAAAPAELRLESPSTLGQPMPESLAGYLARPGIAYAGGLATLLRLAGRGAGPETPVTINQ